MKIWPQYSSAKAPIKEFEFSAKAIGREYYDRLGLILPLFLLTLRNPCFRFPTAWPMRETAAYTRRLPAFPIRPTLLLGLQAVFCDGRGRQEGPRM